MSSTAKSKDEVARAIEPSSSAGALTKHSSSSSRGGGSSSSSGSEIATQTTKLPSMAKILEKPDDQELARHARRWVTKEQTEATPQAIDWECSCLSYYRPVLNGPCSEHFKNAFACVNYTDREQKVMECQPYWNQYYACDRAVKEQAKATAAAAAAAAAPTQTTATSTPPTATASGSA
mmetsp:Transcript_114/g.351  ORF Transcript_114/g.351 Transcript_114/m.351 type:complete len:178 (+) Transcript_114:42-575(+)